MSYIQTADSLKEEWERIAPTQSAIQGMDVEIKIAMLNQMEQQTMALKEISGYLGNLAGQGDK